MCPGTDKEDKTPIYSFELLYHGGKKINEKPFLHDQRFLVYEVNKNISKTQLCNTLNHNCFFKKKNSNTVGIFILF